MKAKQVKAAVASTPGIIRLSLLKSLAQNARSIQVPLSLPDHLITQREQEDEDKDEGGSGSARLLALPWPQAEPPEPSGTRQRRRRPLPLPAAAGEGPEEKGRGRRQRDFGSAEQEQDSDEEGARRERSRTPEEPWTQNQQKLLELALQQHPKGTADRWDKIAKCVPGKSKEECIARYKLLVELVQKKKMAKN